MRKPLVALCWLLVALSWASPSHANGRFPRANQLLIDPGDARHLVLRATYGLLISRDAGETFGFVCESALGFSGDLDPAVTIFENGSIAAGFPRDLRVSADGCDWPSPFSNGSKEAFADVTLDPSDAGAALFVSRRQDAGQLTHLLLASQGDAAPVPLGQPLGDELSPLTLEVAPAEPSRIYVTALTSDLKSVLLRSDDRGETWQRFGIAPHESLPAFIAAIDPEDAGRVYLRLDGATTDYLLVTRDGGASFDEVFAFDTELLGFALSPDGRHVALGGPREGLFLAEASELDFARSPAPLANLSCLKWTADELFACGNETADGFTLASSTDGGRHFTPLFHLNQLSKLSCGAGTDVAARCEAAWSALRMRLGIADAPRAPSTGGGGCALGAARGGSGWPIGTMLVLGGLVTRRRRPRPARRLSRSALGCVLLLTGACSSGASASDGAGGSAPSGDVSCTNDPRVDELRGETSKDGTRGELVFQLLESEPLPPAKGSNRFELRVVDANGEPMPVSLEVDLSMPDHGHGSPKAPEIAFDDAAQSFRVSSLELFMAGVWRVDFRAYEEPGADAPLDEVSFYFCIEG